MCEVVEIVSAGKSYVRIIKVKNMNEQTITVTLPNSVCDRIRTTAQATSLTSEEVIKQSVMPAFESDIPQNHRLNLAKLPLLNDIQLWKAANSVMKDTRQSRLEELAELQKNRSLTKNEQSELSSLMNEAQQTMLCKAEARRILAQRGHVIFKAVEH
ncbi:MAG: hypothetical protein B6245_12765 [Desulfobacteraceae bacterium 4572_88]|nr:MAG: hypothetical protein B6245_12765 [Desulfobacteraceae bacterium 4572_88]